MDGCTHIDAGHWPQCLYWKVMNLQTESELQTFLAPEIGVMDPRHLTQRVGPGQECLECAPKSLPEPTHYTTEKII